MIPKSVKKIEAFAFGDCFMLKEIVFEGELEKIDIHQNSFCNCPFKL